MFVSDLRQVGDFLSVLSVSPPIKQLYNITEILLIGKLLNKRKIMATTPSQVCLYLWEISLYLNPDKTIYPLGR
jgi:hypothetical protein